MAEVNVKQVNGGENSNPAASEGILLDNGTTSTWTQIANLHKNMTQATATQAAVVELATDAEAITGTDTARAITPANLNAVLAAKNGYTLDGMQNVFAAPADSTVYYFGRPFRAVGQTTAATRRIYIPLTGTIARADITVNNSSGVQGSAETSTLVLRLNNTTDTTLSSAIVNNQASEASSFFNITGLAIAVATGDYVEFKWTTPAWATNPTNVTVYVSLYITVP